MIITSSSLAEAAPLNNENPDVQITAQATPTELPIEIPKVEPVEQPVPAPVVAKPVQPKPKPVITGDKYTWMTQAGIPESEWEFVDYIVSRESGWNPCAYYPGRSDCSATPTSACGLAQALPCSKLGTNWYDPVHALKWQYNYVKARYGGYQQAVAFWKINHWY